MRPLRKTCSIKVRVSPGELEALEALAGGRPLGPSMVAAALGASPAESAPVVWAEVPMTPVEHVAALERWASGLDRYSTAKAPLLRLLPQVAALVRSA